jgi:hypothetical protein
MKTKAQPSETFYEVTAAQMVLFVNGKQVIFAKPEPEQKYTGLEKIAKPRKAKK